MIDDVILIEKCDRLLDIVNLKNTSEKQKLLLLESAILGIKNNAETRLKEFEDAEAPSDEPFPHVQRARENAKIEGFIR